MKNLTKKETNNTLCATPGCREVVGEQSITRLCKACYSYVYNNNKRSPRQLVQRSHKIRLFASRLNFILPDYEFRATKTTPNRLLVLPGEVQKYRRRTRHKPPLKVIK